MSNTTQEFSKFVQLANQDPEKSPSVLIVDGAQGGQDAEAWTIMPGPWDTLNHRLHAAGTSSQQVQVAWIKQALKILPDWAISPLTPKNSTTISRRL